jgi:hypothetical protein
VSNEELHVALPKLYGAPAYARPPRPIEERPRPIDFDDLPIEAFRTGDDLALLGSSGGSGLTSDSGSNGHGRSQPASGAGSEPTGLEPRPFSLKSLSRFISGR